MTGADALVEQLARRVPNARLITDPDVTRGYATDQLPLLRPATPAAVLVPVTEEDVSAALRIASELRCRVVVRGAGSGLTGGANAEDDCLVIVTTGLTGIQIDAEERTATVRAGTLLSDVKRAAAERGLFYPPDPASSDFCTIGGTVATNAGGLCCVKYGATKDYLLAARLVLPDGETITLGATTPKRSIGLDLTRLLPGSEGVLGVLTEVTVRLVPAPAPATTVVATLPTLQVAAAAVRAVLRSAVTPSLCELIDNTTIRAVEEWQRMDLDTSATGVLLVQTDSPGSAQRDGEELAGLLAHAGADEVYVTSDPAETDLILGARRLAYPALERRGKTLLEDINVPRTTLVETLTGIEEVGRRHGLTIGTFGHIGDGNLHPTIVYDHDDPAAEAAAQAAFHDIAALALEMGGTCSGEHGTGRLKADLARAELGPVVQRLTDTVRTVFDPSGVLLPSPATVGRTPLG